MGDINVGGVKIAGSPGELAARIALVEIGIAAPILMDPNAWRVAAIVFTNQCNPEQVLETAGEWADLADDMRQAKQAVADLIAEVNEGDWHGLDRADFEKRMETYKSQLDGIGMMAQVVGVALTVMGTLLVAMVAAMTACATVLFGLAVYVQAARMIPPLAGPAQATVVSVCTTVHTILKTLEKAIEMTGRAMAGTIAAALAVDVAWQSVHGNQDVYGDLLVAAFDGVDTAALGTAALWEQNHVAHMVAPPGARTLITPAMSRTALGYGAVENLGVAPTGDNGAWEMGPGGAASQAERAAEAGNNDRNSKSGAWNVSDPDYQRR